MANILKWSQGLLQIVADTSAKPYAPVQVWTLPEVDPVTSISATLEARLGSGRVGVRVTSNQNLPGTQNTVWALEWTCFEAPQPNPLIWNSVPIVHNEAIHATQVFDDGTVITATDLTLTDTTKSWTTDQWAGKLLKIVDGAGTGQQRICISNTADTITWAVPWTILIEGLPVPLLDDTSEYTLSTPDVNFLITDAAPLSTYKFRLAAVETTGRIYYPEVSIDIPTDPTLQALIDALEDISFDGKLSDGAEKTTLRIWWGTAQASQLVALADEYGLNHTGLTEAYDVLALKADAWMGTGTVDLTAPEWNAPNPTLEEMWVDYFIEEAALREAIALYRQTQTLSALNAMYAITSDGIISDAERPTLRGLWSVCETEYPELVAASESLWGTEPTESLYYRNAYAALAQKEPYWDGVAHDGITISGNTDISGWDPTLSAMWSTYQSERTILQTAMTTKVQSNYLSLLTALNTITDDGKLTNDEKSLMKAWWTPIPWEYEDILGMWHVGVADPGEKKLYYESSYALLDECKALWGWVYTAGVWGWETPGTGSTGAVDISALSPTLYTRWSNYWTAKGEFQRVLIADQNTNITTAQGRADQAYDAAVAAAAAASAAQTSANAANTLLTNIASDSILSPVEKPQVKLEYDKLIAEKTGIDAQAGSTQYADATPTTGTTALCLVYDTAITALTTYLGTLTAPVAWNVFTGDTTIVGTTFRSKFSDVYTARQNLLNAISAKARALILTAQTTATNAANAASAAQTSANAANTLLINIASDDKLTPDEKPQVIKERDILVAEQAGIDAQAVTYACTAVTAAKAIYDATLSASNTGTSLIYYLSTLTSPVGWTVLTDYTTIVGSTFRDKFKGVYAARQTLLNAIATQASAQINSALAEIYNMSQDSIISQGEKPVLQARWVAAQGIYETLGDKARTTGTVYNYFVTAYEALSALILAMTPPLNDYTESSAIDSTTFYTAWSNWDQAVNKLSTSLTTSTPVIDAATTSYVALTGTATTCTVDGVAFPAASGGKFLLVGQSPDNGVYTLSATSSGGGTSAVFATSYSSAAVTGTTLTSPELMVDQNLATCGTVVVNSSATSSTTRSRVTILSGFPSGPSPNGTLSIKLRVAATYAVGGTSDGWGKVIGAYSIDGGVSWTLPIAWNWAATDLNQNYDSGVITLTLPLTGITMSLLQVRLTASASSARTVEPV